MISSATLLFGSWILGTIVAFVSYRIAGPIWVASHSLRGKLGARDFTISGAWGESMLMGMFFILLWAVDGASSEVNLGGLVSKHVFWWLGAFNIIFLAVAIYSAREASSEDGLNDIGAPPKRLRATYAVYSLYSALMFMGGVLLVVLVSSQFGHDSDYFAQRSQEILTYLDGITAMSAEHALRRIENANIDATLLMNRTQIQLTPIFIAASGIFVVNFVLRYTPLGNLFQNGAVLVTNVATAVALAGIFGGVGFVYADLYSEFNRAFLDQALLARPLMDEAFWEVAIRYGELMIEADHRRSIIRFVVSISNEWGGVAAALGIAQWMASSVLKKDDASEKAT